MAKQTGKISSSEETGKIREKRSDVGPKKPPIDKRFSSTNQPDPAKQKATKAKKKVFRELIREMLNGKYKFADDSQIKKQLVTAFGPEILNKTTGEIMILQQMQKSILKADSQSFMALLDRVEGRPVQAIAQTDSDGDDLDSVPVVLNFPKGINFSLPGNTEGEE